MTWEGTMAFSEQEYWAFCCRRVELKIRVFLKQETFTKEITCNYKHK